MPASSAAKKLSGSSKQKAIHELEELLLRIRVISRSDASQIKPLALRIISIATEVNNKNYEGIGKIELAHSISSSENNYKKAIELCDEGFEMMSPAYKNIYEPYYHLNKGRAFQFLGEEVNAQDEYLKSIRILEFRDKLKPYQKGWLASTYYNLFILFNKEGVEFTQDEYLQKAFQLYESISDKSGMANCYNSFAVYYYKKKDLHKALEYLQRAYIFAAETNARTYLSIFCSNLGLVYAKLGKLNEGLKYFEESKQINLEINSQYHTAHTYQQLGEAYYSNNFPEKALTYYRKAEKIYLVINVKTVISTVYQHISNAYLKLGQYKKAFEYERKYSEILKEQFNDEKTFAIAKARNQFDLEKKEKEAELLRIKSAEIEKYAMQLEISNNQLKQFAHIASHDLKEPLRMVSSYATLLERSFGNGLDDDQKEFLKFIMEGTHTMHKLVNDLLELSNINYIENKIPVNLNKVMKLVVTNLDSTIKERNAKITCLSLPTVKAEETQMLQLFLNLISNAIKYNTSKVPAVKISAKKKKGTYEFSIADNGIGIPEEYRTKIFMIFQRLHTRNEYSGTGIGLTICKKIVEQLNGTIWLESNPEGGSIFKFTIPA